MSQRYGWLTSNKAAAAIPETSAGFWRSVAKSGRVPVIKVGPKFLIDIDRALEILATPATTTNTTAKEREAS